MKTDSTNPNSSYFHRQQNWSGQFRRILLNDINKESRDDLRVLAECWMKIAIYDFEMLGLNCEKPADFDFSQDPGLFSRWQTGREIVARHRANQYANSMDALYDAIMLQRVVIHFLSPEPLRLRAESIRTRFQALVGSELFDRYFPDYQVDAGISTDNLRAELDFILAETMYVYMITPLRPLSRGRLLAYCLRPFLLISIAMIFTSCVMAYVEKRFDQFATLAMIPVFGAMGAMISLQQRVENLPNRGDAVRNIMALESGRETLWTTSIAGAIFGVILNLIYAGRIIEGNLFPSFQYLFEAKYNSGSGGVLADISKMLIWAFIAGFAERLVPDTITRLTQVLRNDHFDQQQRRPLSGKYDDLDYRPGTRQDTAGSGYLVALGKSPGKNFVGNIDAKQDSPTAPEPDANMN
ncbi:MAG: hypothetical protein ACKO85_18345 [Isosphaeraceae bacterium]